MILDLFEQKSISPMLLTEGEAFDSLDYIYELKLDGIRSVVYLDGTTDIRNKRNKMVTTIYPELKHLNQLVSTRCILDGEIIVMEDGKPNFFEIQRRSLLTNDFKIQISSSKLPVTFVAFDILYVDHEELLRTPLMERKKILNQVVQESERLAISRFIPEKGLDFYQLSVHEQLEGVVAKRKESVYYQGKRSKDWIKFKNMLDDDFIICGVVVEAETLKSIALGIFNKGSIINCGHVSLGIPKEEMRQILNYATSHSSPCPYREKIEDGTLWCVPQLVCTVKFMMRTTSGSLRQPVYKGLRLDKSIEECQSSRQL